MSADPPKTKVERGAALDWQAPQIERDSEITPERLDAALAYLDKASVLLRDVNESEEL